MNRQEFAIDYRAARLAAKFKPAEATPTPTARSCVVARKVKPSLPFILRWDRQARADGTLYLHPQAFGLALRYRTGK